MRRFLVLVVLALVGFGVLPGASAAQEVKVGDIQLSVVGITGPELSCPLPNDFSSVNPKYRWYVETEASVPPVVRNPDIPAEYDRAQYVLEYRILTAGSPPSGWTSDGSEGSQAMGYVYPSQGRQTIRIRTPIWLGSRYEMRLSLGVGGGLLMSPSITVDGPPGITCSSIPPNDPAGAGEQPVVKPERPRVTAPALTSGPRGRRAIASTYLAKVSGQVTQTASATVASRKVTVCSASTAVTKGSSYKLICPLTRSGIRLLRTRALRVPLSTTIATPKGDKATSQQLVRLPRTR